MSSHCHKSCGRQTLPTENECTRDNFGNKRPEHSWRKLEEPRCQETATDNTAGNGQEKMEYREWGTHPSLSTSQGHTTLKTGVSTSFLNTLCRIFNNALCRKDALSIDLLKVSNSLVNLTNSRILQCQRKLYIVINFLPPNSWSANVLKRFPNLF